MKPIRLYSTALALVLAAGAAQAQVRVAHDCPLDPVACGTYVWGHTFAEYLNAHGIATTELERGAMGEEAERLDQVSTGLLEVSLSDTRSAGSLEPFIYGVTLPFLFATHAAFDEANVAHGLLARVNEGTTPQGVRVLAMVANGSPAGVFNTRHPVNTIDDMSDLRMRALDQTQIGMYEAWGSQGTIVSWPEVPSAMQTGVIDGYVNAPIVPLMFGHQDFLRHFTDVRISAPFRTAIASEDWYQGLTDEERAIVDEAAAQATAANRAWVEGQASVLGDLEAAGVAVVHLSDEERERFAQASSALYQSDLLSAEDVAVWLAAAGREGSGHDDREGHCPRLLGGEHYRALGGGAGRRHDGLRGVLAGGGALYLCVTTRLDRGVGPLCDGLGGHVGRLLRLSRFVRSGAISQCAVDDGAQGHDGCHRAGAGGCHLRRSRALFLSCRTHRHLGAWLHRPCGKSPCRYAGYLDGLDRCRHSLGLCADLPSRGGRDCPSHPVIGVRE